MGELYLRVATIGAARGLTGQVRLQVHTDDPESQLAPGAQLTTEPAEAGPLRVASLRRVQERWHATFAGVSDRAAAEALRGVVLLAPPQPDEPDAWYPHQLLGLRAERADGTLLGTVDGVEHLPAQDALILCEPGGQRTLVPFVTEIVPVVDVRGGRVVLDPPVGLLASDTAETSGSGAVENTSPDQDGGGEGR